MEAATDWNGTIMTPPLVQQETQREEEEEEEEEDEEELERQREEAVFDSDGDLRGVSEELRDIISKLDETTDSVGREGGGGWEGCFSCGGDLSNFPLPGIHLRSLTSLISLPDYTSIYLLLHFNYDDDVLMEE